MKKSKLPPYLFNVILITCFALLLCIIPFFMGKLIYAWMDEPNYYIEGEEIPVWVFPTRSSHSFESKDYYSLNPCAPEKSTSKPRTTSEIIRGEEGKSSPYKVHMLVNSGCVLLTECGVSHSFEELQRKQKLFVDAIQQGHRGYMKLDDLYVANNGVAPGFHRCNHRPKYTEKFFKWGYALGVPKACTGLNAYINNHLHFVIYYRQRGPSRDFDEPSKEVKEYMIMGVHVVPYSVTWPNTTLCKEDMDIESVLFYPFHVGEFSEPTWSYSVEWKPFDSYTSQWGGLTRIALLQASTCSQLVYVSLNVLAVLGFCLIVVKNFLGNIRADMKQYENTFHNQLQEEAVQWLVHEGALEPPAWAGLLSVMVGSGYQVLSTLAAVILSSLLGAIPSLRKNSILFLYYFFLPFMAFIGGYACGFLLQYLNRKTWKHVFLFGSGIPGMILAMHMTGDRIVRRLNSSDTEPFTNMGYFLSLFAVNLLFSITGAFFAFNRKPLRNPLGSRCFERNTSKQMPRTHWFTLYILSPLFPFLSIVLELQYLTSAILIGQINYPFSLLALSLVVWVAVCALVTVFQFYYLLRSGSDCWLWTVFMIPGSMGLHMFLYSIYLCLRLRIKGLPPIILYFMCMGMVSIGYGLAAGAIGVTAGIVFLRTMHGKVQKK